MDVWTIQKKEIIESVKNGATWFPDADKSDFDDLKICYRAAIAVINHLNNTRHKGVVFTMIDDNGQPFKTVKDLAKKLNSNRNLFGFLSKNGESLINKDSLIVKLTYPDEINPAPLDICAFTALSDFLSYEIDSSMQQWIVFNNSLYAPYNIKSIYKSWIAGGKPILMFKTCSTILQLHYGFISPENLTEDEYPANYLCR